MIEKERIAKWLCYAAPFAIFGGLMSGRPTTTATAFLLLAPYTYIQYKKGRAESKPSTGE